MLGEKRKLINLLIYPIACFEIFLPPYLFIIILGAKLGAYAIAKSIGNKKLEKFVEKLAEPYIILAKILNKIIDKFE